MFTKPFNKLYIVSGVVVVVAIFALVFIKSADAASATGSGVITAVGTEYVTINNGANPGDNIYYPTSTTGTIFLGGTNAYIVGEYISFVGDVDTNGFIIASTITVDTPPIPVTFNLYQPNGQVGVPYNTVRLLSTGVNPVVVSATGVPPGMSVSATGDMSGTPTADGVYIIKLSATDAKNTTGTGVVAVTILPGLTPVTFVTNVANGKVGTAYTSTNLVLTGATPVEVTATGVPVGMSVSSTGDLSGTPTTIGTYNINLKGIGSDGNEATGTTILKVQNVSTNKDDCKKDGWKNFTNPKFKNQGDCVSNFERDEKDKNDKKDKKDNKDDDKRDR